MTIGVHLPEGFSVPLRPDSGAKAGVHNGTSLDWPRLDTLKELRHPQVPHRWGIHVDARSGSVLAASDFVIHVQRLGVHKQRYGPQMPFVWSATRSTSRTNLGALCSEAHNATIHV